MAARRESAEAMHMDPNLDTDSVLHFEAATGWVDFKVWLVEWRIRGVPLVTG